MGGNKQQTGRHYNRIYKSIWGTFEKLSLINTSLNFFTSKTDILNYLIIIAYKVSN